VIDPEVPLIDTPLPQGIQGVLEEYRDIMPEQLPPGLRIVQAMDHRMELEPGARPPARSPYRMAPPELAELRKQRTD